MSVVRVCVGALFWTQRDFNLPPARSKFVLYLDRTQAR
jgi:hypothetical protein